MKDFKRSLGFYAEYFLAIIKTIYINFKILFLKPIVVGCLIDN